MLKMLTATPASCDLALLCARQGPTVRPIMANGYGVLGGVVGTPAVVYYLVPYHAPLHTLGRTLTLSWVTMPNARGSIQLLKKLSPNHMRRWPSRSRSG